jgi:hypothetical protein
MAKKAPHSETRARDILTANGRNTMLRLRPRRRTRGRQPRSEADGRDIITTDGAVGRDMSPFVVISCGISRETTEAMNHKRATQEIGLKRTVSSLGPLYYALLRLFTLPYWWGGKSSKLARTKHQRNTKPKAPSGTTTAFLRLSSPLRLCGVGYRPGRRRYSGNRFSRFLSVSIGAAKSEWAEEKHQTRKLQTPEKLQAPNFNRRFFDGWVWLTSARVGSDMGGGSPLLAFPGKIWVL